MRALAVSFLTLLLATPLCHATAPSPSGVDLSLVFNGATKSATNDRTTKLDLYGVSATYIWGQALSSQETLSPSILLSVQFLTSTVNSPSNRVDARVINFDVGVEERAELDGHVAVFARIGCGVNTTTMELRGDSDTEAGIHAFAGIGATLNYERKGKSGLTLYMGLSSLNATPSCQGDELQRQFNIEVSVGYSFLF